ncbi:vitelline membrane outer layer protein 1 homolog [Mercenaria mercenaria]|uniref:vitelline membrane outer layer protein 1 homolog n=1 Tax=Mercenaria mercenaria TaxID=6596 RepID=UPI00234EC0E7|nr:vitelline membrane outer layer protein 1 homolog [Mercenaria mercenaria]
MVVFQRFRTDNPTESPGFETDTPVSRQASNDSSGVGTSNSEGVTTVSPGFVIGTRTISPGFETVSPATGTASAVSSDVPIVIATLKVTNGGWWGAWGSIQLCPAGSYAVGYDMRIEPKRDSDCTALNAIKLLCEFPDGKDSGEVTSAQGPWGTWVGRVKCTSDVRGRQYLTSFALQVEKYQGQNTGDTAANYVKFSCRDRRGHQKPQELVKSPGHGIWGTWGAWSASCPQDTAICGIKTKVEKPQGTFGDDTALNDVQFYCCL